jgi:glycosyltransferase involved in cell wall biosynthesis
MFNEVASLPEITILMPVWKRSEFLPLVLMNLKSQDYPHENLRLLIDDDTENVDERFIKNLQEVKDILNPIKVEYITGKPRRSIGKKRNDLVKACKTKIWMFFDSDDVYLPTAISYSYSVLKMNKFACVGSDKMIFCMCDRDFDVHAIDCGNNKRLIHEASLMGTVKWWRASCKFSDGSRGEGAQLFAGHESKVGITDVSKVMICIQHGENTIDKLQFAKDENKLKIEVSDEMKDILKKILK